MVISFGGQHLPDLYNTRNVAQSTDRTVVVERAGNGLVHCCLIKNKSGSILRLLTEVH